MLHPAGPIPTTTAGLQQELQRVDAELARLEDTRAEVLLTGHPHPAEILPGHPEADRYTDLLNRRTALELELHRQE